MSMTISRNPGFISFLLAATIFVSSQAEDTMKVKEPEYVGVFFSLDSKSGELVALERQVARARAKAKALGFGGAEVSMEIPGDKSPIRFKTAAKLEFVVKMKSQENDPQSLIGFYLMESTKGKRVVSMAKTGGFGIDTQDTSKDGKIQFDAVKYGTSSFKFSPSRDLVPGEYVVGLEGVSGAFCFGIDGDRILDATPSEKPKKGQKSKADKKN